MIGSLDKSNGVFKHQPMTELDQDTPVQNTWYTVVDKQNCNIYFVTVRVNDTGETLEFKATIDGVVYTGSQAALATTWYYLYKSAISTAALLTSTSQFNFMWNDSLSCRAFKLEVRKTTASGTGTLKVKVDFGKI